MNILLITGESGTGKTVISAAVSKRLHAAYMRSRDIAHDLAQGKGFPRTRDWIKSAGIQVATEQLHKEIIAKLATMPSDATVVIDGIYTSEFLAEIDALANGGAMRVVEITAPKTVRIDYAAKMQKADKTTAEEEIEFLDDIKHQAGIQAVANKADLVIENLDSDSTIDEICALLTSPQPDSTQL